MGAYGLTIPLSGIPLHAQRELIASLADLGYTDVWSAESGGADAFTPLALAAAWAPTLRLGTAIVPAFTRGAADHRAERGRPGRRRARPVRARHRHLVGRHRASAGTASRSTSRSNGCATWCASCGSR